MKILEVFDPPMCCSTGVCGPSVDPVLVRFAADCQWLAGQGVPVARHNLAQEPQAYAENELVKAALEKYGSECLPVVIWNGSIVSRGRYPARDELAKLAGLKSGAGLSAARPGCCSSKK